MKQFEDNLLERFKGLISSHIGLCVRQEDIESFRKTLITRMKILNLVEPEGYFNFLKSDTKERKEEWKKLIILFTTGESYFFRDKGHFGLLQNLVLPELVKNKGAQRSLRIWSAGCSTGEEPYSVAILLDMFFPALKGWEIYILGTDINEEALQKAERGIYTKWSFRMLDRDIQGRYFHRHKDEWEIDGRIKKMIKFQYGNMIEDEFFSQNSEIRNMDIIICRNVFIYFQSEAVSAVLNKFTQTLNDGGYLVTGHGELYAQNLVDLRRIMCPEAVLYKKSAEFIRQVSEVKQAPELKKEKKDFRIKKTKNTQPVHPVPEFSKSKIQDPKHQIKELVKGGHYSKAIDKAESVLKACSNDFDIQCLMAQVYANSGDYEKAESACRKAMNINADSADPYFLLAHIAEAKGNNEEAKDFFKKALYLDPAFIAAYCELGGLYEKENDHARAKKFRTTAIELLKSLPPQTPVEPYDITAGELLKFVKDLTGSKDDNLIPAGSKGINRR